MKIAIAESTIVLENDRVLIRELRADDFDVLLPFSINEPQIWRFSLSGADGEENLRKYIQIAIEDRKRGVSYTFIVYDKLKGVYAGSTRYYDIQEGLKTLLLGYTWYGEEFQGSGLNKNCKYLLLKYAFEELEMERVEFRADHNNSRSIAAMKSIGCKPEGVLRSHMPDGRGGRRDSIILSILKQEWFDTVKSNLESKILPAKPESHIH